MGPKATVPTREEIFDTDFNFGHNVPQDSQDSHDSHRLSRITGLSSTSKEKQRALSQLSEKSPSFDPASWDLPEYVRMVYDWRSESQLETERQSEPTRWRSPMFQLARFVRAHPKASDP